ncbi:hypothetical protein EJ110_NYTH11166 [Nymphaea thermarum]|nr:hypothetical protein EJ110_NYTH11166 [Nymphaea thermarum]
MGTFSTKKAREIAIGLELSGHRFLWPARIKGNGFRGGAVKWVTGANQGFGPQLDAVAPQRPIFHDSVGIEANGSACGAAGWVPGVNQGSGPHLDRVVPADTDPAPPISEWVCDVLRVELGAGGHVVGVPMFGWLIYAEQQHNAFVLAKELRIMCGQLRRTTRTKRWWRRET